MRINHNVMASNANRYLSATGFKQSKSLEKISSGLRINTAADDAAGLAISEKMRAQVSGLEQAADNALDGISLLQTAEGALQETHSILQRMRELAVQSANDTNTQAERDEIQKEVDELAKEITRIANNTEFNSKKISNGGLTASNVGELKFHIGSNTGQDISLSLSAMDAKSLGVSRDVLTGSVAVGATHVSSVELASNLGTAIVDGANLALTSVDAAQTTQWDAAASQIAGIVLNSTSNSSEYNDYTLTVIDGSLAASIDHDSKVITISVANTDTDTNINATLNAANINLVATGTVTGVTADSGRAASQRGLGDDEVELTFNSETLIVKDNVASATFTSIANKGVTINFDGSTLDQHTAATVQIKLSSATTATFTAGELDQEAFTAAGVDMSTQTSASAAISTIESAISSVSAERSKLGAYQNRLEHTINNLNTTSENLQASESRIRDVDIAKEMMNFTKLGILQQAAQSMLAQANQAPQGVLQLLR